MKKANLKYFCTFAIIGLFFVGTLVPSTAVAQRKGECRENWTCPPPKCRSEAVTVDLLKKKNIQAFKVAFLKKHKRPPTPIEERCWISAFNCSKCPGGPGY